MSKKTAVEWLALYIKGITNLNCNEFIEQAKEMEKEQIIEAFEDGNEHGFICKTGQEYYNETFKNKEKCLQNEKEQN